jgi:hypothetical protein
METTTPFDLNRAVRQWCENLGQSPAIRGHNLTELESHLRDSIATLQRSGLSAEEAFLVATKRVGNTATLGVEFAKANPEAVWLERFFWAIIALQAWWMIGYLTSSCLKLLTVLAKQWGVADWVSMGLSIVPVPVSAVMVTGIVAWWLFTHPKSKILASFAELSNRPVLLSLAIFLVGTATMLPYGAFHRVSAVGVYLERASYNAVFACLTYILARRRLLKTA